MSTGYYLMAGSTVVDDFDISSSDRTFDAEMRNFRLTLSDKAKLAFSVVCEYSMHPDEGSAPAFAECSNEVLIEIESKLKEFYA